MKEKVIKMQWESYFLGLLCGLIIIGCLAGLTLNKYSNETDKKEKPFNYNFILFLNDDCEKLKAYYYSKCFESNAQHCEFIKFSKTNQTISIEQFCNWVEGNRK